MCFVIRNQNERALHRLILDLLVLAKNVRTCPVAAGLKVLFSLQYLSVKPRRMLHQPLLARVREWLGGDWDWFLIYIIDTCKCMIDPGEGARSNQIKSSQYNEACVLAQPRLDISCFLTAFFSAYNILLPFSRPCQFKCHACSCYHTCSYVGFCRNMITPSSQIPICMYILRASYSLWLPNWLATSILVQLNTKHHRVI